MENLQGFKKRYSILLVFVILIHILFSSTSWSATQEETVDSTTKAIDWIIQNQGSEGYWGTIDTNILETTEILDYLIKNGQALEAVSKGLDWLQDVETMNNDYIARVLPFIQEQERHIQSLNKLLEAQNPDGGWGIIKDFESDLLDTVIVVQSLLKETYIDSTQIQSAISYILEKQHSDGSWSYFGEDGSVYLTSLTVLLLNEYNQKGNSNSTEIMTSLRKAGEYLVSKQLENQTWETEQASLPTTLIAYRAVLLTIGYDQVNKIEDYIISLQEENGSWNNNAYTTVLAIKALEEKQELPFAAISGLKLLKDTEERLIETDQYNPYESVIIAAETEYEETSVELMAFIKAPNGSVFSAHTDGQLSWNTRNHPPGQYLAIVQLKDMNSGRVITSMQKTFSVQPKFKIINTNIKTYPEKTRINAPKDVIVEVSLINQSNVDKQIELNTIVFDQNNNQIASEINNITVQATDLIKINNPLMFHVPATEVMDYTIKTFVYDNQELIDKGQAIFSVLPPAPPTRVDISQGLDKDFLYPGDDQFTVSFKLKGEGTTDTPLRDPLDLVIAIDDSGSMEWGNRDYVYTTPSRLDYAKEAAKHIVDILQPEDRGAVVEYAGSVWTQQLLTSDKEVLKNSIDQTPPSPWDGTSMGMGLQESIKVLSEGSTVERQKVIMLLCDGEENRWSYYKVLNQAYIAKEKGIKIYTIGLGSGANKYLLTNIASITGGIYVHSPTMEQLDQIMNDLAGQIFDTAGKNVVLKTTIADPNLSIEPVNIQPTATSIENNNDGTVTLTWMYDKIIMGQEKNIQLKVDGSNLVSDTTIHLTTGTELIYQDKNEQIVSEKLPDLYLPVNQYKIDTQVRTNQSAYSANQQMEINVTTTNLTDYESTLVGKVELVDSQNQLVEVILPETPFTWQPGETTTSMYSWNTGDIFSGNYQVKVTWFEGNKIISGATIPFEITGNGDILTELGLDNATYSANETVNILGKISNTSTNKVVANLTAMTKLFNSDGELLWSKETSIPEILQNDSFTYRVTWETEQYIPGEYMVTTEIFESDQKIDQKAISFDIIASDKDNLDTVGELEVLTKAIYPADPVELKWSLTNLGNTDLTDLQARIRIVDPVNQDVIGTISENLGLILNESKENSIQWKHPVLKTGNYLVVYDLITKNGLEIPVDSGYFIVENPFTISKEQVTRPRVLVWAESTENIDLAQKTLNEMKVYYTVVHNRESFMKELLTDRYNQYMLLDSKLPLTGQNDQILANEIAKGKGIIASRDANGDNLKNLDLFGAQFIGSLPEKDFTVAFNQNSIFGERVVYGVGKTQRVELKEGKAQASILLDSESKIESYTGAVVNHYHNGKAILFTFDLGTATGDISELLTRAVEFVTPDQELSNRIIEIEIHLQSKAEVIAKLEELVPNNLYLLWSDSLVQENNPEWSLETEPEQEYIFSYIVELPDNDENLAELNLITDAYYQVGTEYFKIDQLVLQLLNLIK